MTTSKLEEKERGKAFIILKRMCTAYGRCPSSFEIKDGIELEGSQSTPYAWGAYGDVYKARYDGRFVAVKAMRSLQQQGDVNRKINKSQRVRSPYFVVVSDFEGQTNPSQIFSREAIFWKWISHQNLVPFLGVNEILFNRLALISEWMEHGGILQFVKGNPGVNRLKLVRTLPFKKQPTRTCSTPSCMMFRLDSNTSMAFRSFIRILKV